MTQIEQLQEQLIDVLMDQVMDLSAMSKIELGYNVISEIKRLNEEIAAIKSEL
jgi:hypothetical protein